MDRKHVVRDRADSMEHIEGLEESVKEAVELLPAWFVPRMMSDAWRFVLLLASGDWVPLSRIESVKQGPAGVWIDALLMDGQGAEALKAAGLKTAPVQLARSRVSINAQHVAMAMEMTEAMRHAAGRSVQGSASLRSASKTRSKGS